VRPLLYRWFRSRGIEATLQELAPDRANVVATIRGAGSGPTLLLAGHLDTSYSGRDEMDYAGLGPTGPNDRPRSFVVDDRVHGLGAFNMKGGLAASAIAMAELVTGPPRAGSVVFAGLAGESEKAPVRGAIATRTGAPYEGRGFGARRFLEQVPRPDYAVVPGPSALRVVNAQAGSLFIEVAVCGTAAYLGRRARRSEGPIEVVAALVAELGTWGDAYRARSSVDSGLGSIEPGLTIGAVEGGWSFAPSTSPAVCHLYLDLRIAPTQSQAAALRELRAHLRSFAERQRGVTVRARVFARGRGTMTPSDHPLVRCASEILERDLGLEAAPFPAGSADTSNDTNIFRQAGIPSIKVGPGGVGERTATENVGVHVKSADLVVAANLYVRLAHRLLSEGGAA
jgi:acetylornithine deacetylase